MKKSIGYKESFQFMIWYLHMFSIRNIIIKLKIMFVASQIFCNVLRSAAQIVTTQHRFYFIYFQNKRGFLIKKSYWFILKFASIEKKCKPPSKFVIHIDNIKTYSLVYDIWSVKTKCFLAVGQVFCKTFTLSQEDIYLPQEF